MGDMKTIKTVILYFLLLASFSFPLMSCTTLYQTQHQPLQMSWAERSFQLGRLNNFNIQGAIAIRSSRNSGSASFRWQQINQDYTLSLFGPFGANTIQIQGHPGKIVLWNAQGQQYQANQPEQLLLDQTGWNLPITSLYYWIRGLPAPGQPYKSEFDVYHRLSKLTQQKWQIYFRQYDQFHQIELPTKLELIHPQLRVKLVIYWWS